MTANLSLRLLATLWVLLTAVGSAGAAPSDEAAGFDAEIAEIASLTAESRYLEAFGDLNSDDDVRELTNKDFARAIPHRQRQRILRGEINPRRTSSLSDASPA